MSTYKAKYDTKIYTFIMDNVAMQHKLDLYIDFIPLKKYS